MCRRLRWTLTLLLEKEDFVVWSPGSGICSEKKWRKRLHQGLKIKSSKAESLCSSKMGSHIKEREKDDRQTDTHLCEENWAANKLLQCKICCSF